MNEIRHDDDGFLLPKKERQNIEQILENTEKLLQRHQVPTVKRVRAAVPVVRVNVNAPKAAFRQPKSQKQPENTRPTPVQKREQADRAMQLRQEKVQTEHLEEIAKNSKPQSKSNALMKGVGALAGLAKMPFNAVKGGFKGGKNALMGMGGRKRGANGQFLPKGATPKDTPQKGGIFGKAGKLLKGVAKGGLVGAFLGLLSGAEIENSDMTRPEKNKAHAKNAMIGVGGLGGAMAGAAIGSVVPVVGTVVGGILGGFGGAALMEHWVNWLDDRIPENFSNRMFGSWDGFVGTIKDLWRGFIGNSQTHFANFVAQTQAAWQTFAQFATDKWTAFSGSLNSMASAVWETFVPQSFRTYFADLTTWGKAAWDNATTWSKAAWDNVSSYAASFWESAKSMAQTAFNLIAKPLIDKVQPVIETVQPVIENTIDTVKQVGQNAANNIKNVGNKIADAWNNSSLGQMVNGAVGNTVDTGKEIAGNAVEIVKQTGSSLKSGALNFLGYDMTQKYDHLKYGMGSKNLGNGSIDCSGWSFQVTKMEMESLNNMLGFEKYKIKGNQAGSLNLGMHGAAEQIGLVSQQHGVVTDTRSGFDKSKLQAGMMIGQMKYSAGYKGRATNVKGYGKTQYNHIVKVVRGKNGELYISESQGGSKNGGVTLTKMDKWVDMRVKRGDTLTAVNPFGDDIGLLNGSMGAIAKNEVRKGANFVAEKAMQGAGAIRDWVLGQTSKKYETGGKGAGTISSGKGDKGGVSYGSYQMSSKMGVVQDFVKKSAYASQFQGLQVNSEAFKQKWRELAQNDPNFAKAQHDYIQQTHYAPQMAKLRKNGMDFSQRGAAVQDAVWSTAVQFGGGTGLIINALKGKNVAQMSDNEIVTAIQDHKINNNEALFKSSSADNRKGTLARAKAEKADLLKLVNAAPHTPVIQAAAPVAPQITTPVMPSKPIAPPPVLTHAAPAPVNPPKTEFLGTSVFGGSIAHKPVSRTVNHKQIAHMASGGIMDNQV